MTTYDSPAASQVAVMAPGSSSRQYLGALGHVTALNWSFICPGGADQLNVTVEVPASYRTQLFNPGLTAVVYRGGHQVWDGKMDEPVPTASGWNMTAVGTGNLGQNFLAVYTDPWPTSEPDESVNGAISRGLPWGNAGIGSPAGIWLGQAVDSGAQTITALLNLACTRGALTWYVNSQPGGSYLTDDLNVFSLPTTVDRLLVCNTPVARTLGGDINSIWIKYQITADNSSTGATATYGVTNVVNQASINVHGTMETYIDLSDVGVMSSGAAQAVGNNVLAIYQRASFAGPFQVSPGQVLNLGGQPVDLGAEQAGHVYRLLLTDFGYGGEVTPQFPITFIGGQYAWDDITRVGTITPYVALNQSLTGLLSMENTVMVPIQAASGP